MERLSEEIMAETFPNLTKKINLHMQEVQQTICQINSETTHHNQNQRQREDLEVSKTEVTHNIKD